MWLSWLGVVPQSRRSPVQLSGRMPGWHFLSPVRAGTRGNDRCFSHQCLPPSLYFPLSKNK